MERGVSESYINARWAPRHLAQARVEKLACPQMTVIRGLRERSELDKGRGDVCARSASKFERFSLGNRPSQRQIVHTVRRRYAAARYARRATRALATLVIRGAVQVLTPGQAGESRGAHSQWGSVTPTAGC